MALERGVICAPFQREAGRSKERKKGQKGRRELGEDTAALGCVSELGKAEHRFDLDLPESRPNALA